METAVVSAYGGGGGGLIPGPRGYQTPGILKSLTYNGTVFAHDLHLHTGYSRV